MFNYAIENHEGIEIISNTCKICGKCYANGDILLNHIKSKHSESKLPFKCVYSGCGKSFATMYQRKNHITRIHHPERMRMCNQCGESFLDASQVKRHVSAVHIKPSSTCEECGKIYVSYPSYMRHLQSHKNIVFKCECGKE
uniref:Zinc finger protein n=1 Tax=Panagrolaimus superbus TaxID=310955 RepID=A0A914XRX1_9BILA